MTEEPYSCSIGNTNVPTKEEIYNRIEELIQISKIDKAFASFISDLVSEIDYDIWKEHMWLEEKRRYAKNPEEDCRMKELVVWAKKKFKELGLKYEADINSSRT